MTTTLSPMPPRPESPPRALIDRRVLNLPNLITVSRLLLAVVLFVLIDVDGWWRTAAGLFVIAAFTDFLDGYLARKYGQVTVLGRILDPFVDKIIICGAFIFLQGKTDDGLFSGVTGWMTFIIVAREMFITSLRAVLEQYGKDFSAQWSGKLKMIVQCLAVPVCLLSLSRPFLEGIAPLLSGEEFARLRDGLLWVTVGITLYSGVEYVLRAVRLWNAAPPASPEG
jgi:CDP-diacylglycerol--glycerol-3-phosphate 3-phosphatidyltransferase